MMVWLGSSLIFMTSFHFFCIKMYYNLCHDTFESVKTWNLECFSICIVRFPKKDLNLKIWDIGHLIWDKDFCWKYQVIWDERGIVFYNIFKKRLKINSFIWISWEILDVKQTFQWSKTHKWSMLIASNMTSSLRCRILFQKRNKNQSLIQSITTIPIFVLSRACIIAKRHFSLHASPTISPSLQLKRYFYMFQQVLLQ